jgi:hypothetical protein
VFDTSPRNEIVFSCFLSDCAETAAASASRKRSGEPIKFQVPWRGASFIRPRELERRESHCLHLEAWINRPLLKVQLSSRRVGKKGGSPKKWLNFGKYFSFVCAFFRVFSLADRLPDLIRTRQGSNLQPYDLKSKCSWIACRVDFLS